MKITRLSRSAKTSTYAVTLTISRTLSERVKEEDHLNRVRIAQTWTGKALTRNNLNTSAFENNRVCSMLKRSSLSQFQKIYRNSTGCSQT